ncbi:MAG TPA: hypothetical protein VIM02_09915, partial [Rhizomicrobium sp.]
MSEVENPSILKKGRSHPNTLLAGPPAAANYRESDLVHWHISDMPPQSPHVCYQGDSVAKLSLR